MNNFCEFCGAKLENDTGCTCGEAEAALENERTTPQNVTDIQNETPIPADTAMRQQEQPVLNSMQQSESTAIANKETTYREVKRTLINFIKDPVRAASNSAALSKEVIVSLLGIQAAAATILAWISAYKVMSVISRRFSFFDDTFSIGGSFFDEAADIPISFPFTTLLLMVIEIVLMFGCLYLMLKIFKSKKNTMQVLSSLAIASIPWSEALLIMAVFMLLPGTSGLSGMIILMLTIFAAVSSICLLGASLFDAGISSLNNVLIISVSYAVHYVLFLYFAQSINSDLLFSLRKGLFGI